MRVDNHNHIRHIVLYHFEKGWTAAQSFRDLNELFGQGTITQQGVQKWFARFKSGDTSLEDKPGRGRPSDFDDQALLAAVEEDESLTTRMLAEQFDVDHSTIVRHLKKLGKVWKLAGWVPHELSQQNKDERVRIFSDLLRKNEETPFLNNFRINPVRMSRVESSIRSSKNLGSARTSSLQSHRGFHRLPRQSLRQKLADGEVLRHF